MSELDEIRTAAPGLKSQIKAAQRTLRGTLQYLADFEERLDRVLAAQPEEAQRNERDDHGAGAARREHVHAG